MDKENKDNHTLRVFEAFAGIGAQASALDRMGINYKIVGISEWFIDAIECYAAIHCDNVEVEMPTDIQTIDEYLSKFTFSATSVKPTNIKRLTEDQRRDLYRANKQANNFGSITDIKGADLPEIDLLVYSFPCQDLSTGGLGKGMKKGSGTRSGLLWEIERILTELKDLDHLPEYLLLENVKTIKADKHIKDLNQWLDFLESMGYANTKCMISDIYKKYSSSLLESNVRSFLKFNGGVNKGIRGTILNQKSRFFTYNNGISTTASAIEVDRGKNGELIITAFTNLQIINGGQTTATLAATSIKNNADLSGIYVQMKLTVLKESDPDLIRCIATYANSQNKVKTADLNSSHPFYVRVEEYSRKVYAPAAEGQIVQTLWFFERTRGQYEQPLMQMTKAQREDYKLVRPKSKKYTLADLAKYMNAADILPHYVSWGGEVNAAHFHNNMVKQWDKDNSVYNELFYKELIGKKILFEHIGNIVSNQVWYQENRAYRPQLIAYTFAKLVFVAQKVNKQINYRLIWDLQEVPSCIDEDIAAISKIAFDVMYDENRPTANIESYCKREECWTNVAKQNYTLSEDGYGVLITPAEKQEESVRAKKDQRIASGIEDELGIFRKGSDYWKSLAEKGKSQNVLSSKDLSIIDNAVKYCEFVYTSLYPKQVKEINIVLNKLKENGIE